MKEPLLLLHGALGSQHQLQALKEKLSSSFEVHSFNFEGHGGRATSQDFSIALFTQNVIDYVEEKGLDRVHVFGYSMGGYVALSAALKIPKTIQRIVTLGTKFQWDADSAAQEVNLLHPDKIEAKVPHFAQRLQQAHQPLDWKAVMRQTASMMLRMGAGDRLQDADFKALQLPVVLGIGRLDKMVSYEETERVGHLLPEATVVALDGVKHAIEQVDLAVLVSFVQSALSHP